MADFQFPNFGVPFPFQNLPQQLQASFVPPNQQFSNGSQYGRWNGVNNNAFGLFPSQFQSVFGSSTAPPMQFQPPWGNNGLLGSNQGPGSNPGMSQPQGGAPTPNGGAPAPSGGAPSPYPQPGPDSGNPGFGAPPSSASFANLSDADKAYLYRMQQQYRQDMRGQPGAHQLYFDLFGSQANPTQINSLINDTGLNNPLLPSFNVNAYNGPLKSVIDNLIAQNGGQNLAYGQQGAGSTYRPSTSPYPRGTMIDFRTGQPVGG